MMGIEKNKDAKSKERYQNGLNRLFEVIAGVGNFKGLGNGLHVWPGQNANNDKINRMCLELERAGRIKAVQKTKWHIFYQAVTERKDDD